MRDFWMRVYGWLLGIILLYVCGWLLCIDPVLDLVICNTITGGAIVITLLKLLFALPMARVIGGIGAIIAIKLFM